VVVDETADPDFPTPVPSTFMHAHSQQIPETGTHLITACMADLVGFVTAGVLG